MFLHKDRILWTWCGGVGNTQTACVLAQGQDPMDLVWRCRNTQTACVLAQGQEPMDLVWRCRNTQTACVLAEGQEPMDLVWRCRKHTDCMCSCTRTGAYGPGVEV